MGNNSVPKFIFRLSRFPVYRGSVLGRFYSICKVDNVAAVLMTLLGGPRFGHPLSRVFPPHADSVDRKELQPMSSVQCLEVRHIYMAAVGPVASVGQLPKYHSGCITSVDLYILCLTKDMASTV